MMNPPAHPRMRGVMQNNGPNAQTGAPRTVSKVVPMEQFAIFYYDENGTPRVNVLIKVEDKFYFAPQGMEWCQQLKPVAEWVRKQASVQIGIPDESATPAAANLAADLPQMDAVSIMESPDGRSPQK